MPDPVIPAEPAADLPVRASLTATLLGDDQQEATRILRGELGAPHLVPLPACTDLPGTLPPTRSAVQLGELPVALTPHGWRLTGSRAGSDLAARRARAQHATLLSVTADVLAGEPAGPTLVPVLGPASLVARLALPGGEPVVSDPGAVRDVAQAWVESMAALADSVETSLPGAEVVLDIAEPELRPVTEGVLRSSSGYRVLPAWDQADVAQTWVALAQRARAVLPVQAVDLAGLGELPSLECAGAPRIAVRIRRPETPEGFAPVAAWVESGRDVIVDIPTPAPAPGRIPALARSVALPWRRLGLEAERLGRLIVSTGTETAVPPERLREQAVTVRECADALDQVRHDDLVAVETR